MMTKEKKQQIINALAERVGDFYCPICHHNSFAFLDGYFVDVIQNRYDGMQISGKILPSVIVVCNHCGHIDKFSLGVLGLLEGASNKFDDLKNSENKGLEE